MTPDQQLDLLRSASDREIAKYLAMRVRSERVRHGYSQSSFAEKAGIPLRTYKRFELAGSGSIETLIRVLMALDHARGFFTLFPQPQLPAQKTLIERIHEMSKALPGR